MFDDALSYIGRRDAWGGDQLFGLTPNARLQHLFVVGQTGTGKSTVIRNLIIQDIERGYGVGLIDPHGDLADEILDCLPPTRTIRFIIDKSRILIANLSKGQMGEDKANLLGSLLVTQFQLAAMSRADRPPSKRKPFYLYVDEYHNFATDSFASILSEARKYGLALTLASQYTSQTRPEITNAVFGNVGTMVSFRVGETDAALLARQYGDYQPAAFTSLGNHRVLIKPLIEGEYMAPFYATTMAPLHLRSGRRHIIIAHSRQRFSTKREVIESRIRRWMGEHKRASLSKRRKKMRRKIHSPHPR